MSTAHGRGRGHSLLLQIVLARAAGLAAGEGTLVVALAGVHADMAREVARGRERAAAGGAGVALLGVGGRRGGDGGGGGGRRGGRGVGLVLVLVDRGQHRKLVGHVRSRGKVVEERGHGGVEGRRTCCL